MAEINAAAAVWGLYVPPPEQPPAVELWAELVPVVRLFDALQTQWRTGVGGLVGLDYAVLPSWCRPGAGSRRGRRMLADLQVMERAVLRLQGKGAEGG